MKRFYHFLAIVGIMLAFATSSCNEKAGQAAQQAAESSEQAALAAKQAAQAAQQAVEALQQQGQPCRDVEFLGPIAWNSDTWDPDLKKEVQELAKVSRFGQVAYAPEGDITRIVKSLEINGIYSNSPTQTVIWYEYRTPEGKDINESGEPLSSKILIQGAYKTEEIEDLRTVLNKQRQCCDKKTPCSILLGGCFSEFTGCEPVKNQCKPCKDKVDKDDCIPCKKNPGPGKRQGDGAVPTTNANGNNRKIVTDW